MVTTTTGTVKFRGTNSGKVYTLTAFVDDITLTNLPLSQNGLAATGGESRWVAPEPCDLIDMSFVTGPNVIKVLTYYANYGLMVGKITLFANTISTLNSRTFAPLHVEAGVTVQIQAV